MAGSYIFKQKSFKELREKKKKPKVVQPISLSKVKGKVLEKSSYPQIQAEVEKRRAEKAAMEKKTTAIETFKRLAEKADLQQSIDPTINPYTAPKQTLTSSAAPISSSTQTPPSVGAAVSKKEPFFFPSEEEGARRRMAVFGTEDKGKAAGITLFAGAALMLGGWLAIGAVQSAAAVQAARIGTRGLVDYTTKGWVSSSKWATNTVVQKTATSYFGKITKSKLLLGTVVGLLSTIPWAAHLHADNVIQSLSMVYKRALDYGDPEIIAEAEAALVEASDPDYWRKSFLLVPGINVMDESRKISEAMIRTIQLDKMIAEDKKRMFELGLTPDQIWEQRIKDKLERDEEARRLNEESSKRMSELWQEAKRQERAEEAAYWEKALKNKEKDTKTYQENNDKMWFEYFKALTQSMKGDYWTGYYAGLAERKEETPSKLTFGLL